MKQLLKLLLFLPLLVQAKDINVPAGGSIANANNSAVAGDRILIAAGTFNEPNFSWKLGVSIQGAGIDKTIIKNSSFEWWKASILLHSNTTVAGNQSISDLTMDGNMGKAFCAIGVHNVGNVKIFNVKLVQYFNAAILIAGSPGQKPVNVEIYNFEIIESSRESGGGAYGNILIDGNAENLIIRDGSITNKTTNTVGSWGDTRSGYGIKARPYYTGSVENVGTVTFLISKVRFDSKAKGAWAGSTAPNISIEFWRSKGIGKITGCRIPSHISLEYDYENAPNPSFEVYDNDFYILQGQAMEAAVDNIYVHDNRFYYQNTVNAWNIFGNYNIKKGNPVENQRFENNKFELGGNSPLIYVSYNRLLNLNIAGNTFAGTGKPTLLQLRTSTSAESNRITYKGNSFTNGYNELSFDMGASQRPGNFVVDAGPVIKPPVVEPPVVVPPTTTKTVTITRSEVLGTPSFIKDSVASKYIITVPYVKTETRKEQ